MDYGFVIGSGFVLLGFVVWLVCAYGCYTRAPERRRRPGVWAVLGVLFGPFALFALFLMPKGHTPTKHQQRADAGRRR